MIIKDIQDIHTGQTRTDGRYPQRVGATVSFYLYPSVGSCLYCMYLFDAEGRPKDGYLRTSMVTSVFENDPETIVETLNGRYVFSKE